MTSLSRTSVVGSVSESTRGPGWEPSWPLAGRCTRGLTTSGRREQASLARQQIQTAATPPRRDITEQRTTCGVDPAPSRSHPRAFEPSRPPCIPGESRTALNDPGETQLRQKGVLGTTRTKSSAEQHFSYQQIPPLTLDWLLETSKMNH